MVHHFLDLADYDAATLRTILAESGRLKGLRRTPAQPRPFAGKTLAMIFDKQSTRTRVSFDVAMRELGGETIVLTGKEMQLSAARPSPIPPACCRAMSMPS
jgi:ornithine carbamoyltransferase